MSALNEWEIRLNILWKGEFIKWIKRILLRLLRFVNLSLFPRSPHSTANFTNSPTHSIPSTPTSSFLLIPTLPIHSNHLEDVISSTWTMWRMLGGVRIQFSLWGSTGFREIRVSSPHSWERWVGLPSEWFVLALLSLGPYVWGCERFLQNKVSDSSFANLAKTIVELVAKLGYQRVIMVGHSFGALLNFFMARHYPGLVCGIMSLAGSYLRLSWGWVLEMS